MYAGWLWWSVRVTDNHAARYHSGTFWNCNVRRPPLNTFIFRFENCVLDRKTNTFVKQLHTLVALPQDFYPDACIIERRRCFRMLSNASRNRQSVVKLLIVPSNELQFDTMTKQVYALFVPTTARRIMPWVYRRRHSTSKIDPALTSNPVRNPLCILCQSRFTFDSRRPRALANPGSRYTCCM
jgi:hypothetical protein